MECLSRPEVYVHIYIYMYIFIEFMGLMYFIHLFSLLSLFIISFFYLFIYLRI